MTNQKTSYYQHVGHDVLAKCRTISPEFFRPTAEMADAWGEIFAHYPVSRQAYLAAVASYYASEQACGGKRPSPADIVKHARVVWDLWRVQPDHRQHVEDWDQARREARQRELAPRIAAGQAMAKQAKPGPRPMPADTKQSLENLRRKLRHSHPRPVTPPKTGPESTETAEQPHSATGVPPAHFNPANGRTEAQA